MKPNTLVVPSIVVVIGIVLIFYGLTISDRPQVEAPPPPVVEECLTATILIPWEDIGVTSIGEQVVCAKEWRWSTVYGPSLTDYIEAQKDTEAALLTELARWKDCARDVRYCTEEMKEEMQP